MSRRADLVRLMSRSFPTSSNQHRRRAQRASSRRSLRRLAAEPLEERILLAFTNPFELADLDGINGAKFNGTGVEFG